jgi:hypothetical protein
VTTDPKWNPGDDLHGLAGYEIMTTPNEALRTILPIAGGVTRTQRMSCSPVVRLLQKADIEKWLPIIKAAGIKAE